MEKVRSNSCTSTCAGRRINRGFFDRVALPRWHVMVLL
jgi:hypothetical protein